MGQVLGTGRVPEGPRMLGCGQSWFPADILRAVQRLGHCGTFERATLSGTFYTASKAWSKNVVKKPEAGFEPLDLFSDGPSSLQKLRSSPA